MGKRMKLSEMAAKLGLDFNTADLEISALNALSEASRSELTFVASAQALKQLPSCQASAVLLKPAWQSHCPEGMIAWPVANPALVMARISALFAPPLFDVEGADPVLGEGVVLHPHVTLGKNVSLGDGVVLFPGVVIGDGVHIGAGSVLHPNVTVYRDCQIGERSIIHAGTVIGADGFGYVPDEQGKHVKLHQLGHVVIGNDVEIGANAAIDRATFGATTIADGTKIDNLVHIAHNVMMGSDVIVCGQVGFAGSSRIGDRVTIGSQSGVAGHLSIAEGSRFAARSGVTKTIATPGGVYAGFPARPHGKWLKDEAVLARLIKRYTKRKPKVEAED